jgi:ABC-2 type transport system permease protein
MSITITLSTARRILRQLAHDHRTIAMLLGVPTMLLTLLYFMFDQSAGQFDRVALVMLGVFPFILMFLITSIAMLRERSSGTLERLLTTPAGRGDLLFGYGLAFGLAAAAQATVATLVATEFLGLQTSGPTWLVILIAVINGFLGVSLGLCLSAFAHSEFQAVQFMPVVGIPQLLLCGLFVPRDHMAAWLDFASQLMPLTYAVEALEEVGSHPAATGLMWTDVGVVAGGAVLALVTGAATLRRRTA